MSGCQCSCDPGDWCDPDDGKVIKIKNLTSRKEHRCIECKGEIAKGEECQAITYTWEEGIATDYVCLICRKIRENHCSCAPYGSLALVLEEELGAELV